MITKIVLKIKIINNIKNDNIRIVTEFNSSRHSLFFPGHVTASGHIEPDSSGHMRPVLETAYPFSPTPHRSCRRALDTFSIDIIKFNIVYVACKVSNYI